MTIGKGGLRIEPKMKKFEKKSFASYSDAEIFISNTDLENDGVIRKEGGEYYIFVESANSQELQGL
jgi:hypothetical protein